MCLVFVKIHSSSPAGKCQTKQECYGEKSMPLWNTVDQPVELYILISCRKGPELTTFSSGLVFPSVFYYFTITSIICKCNACGFYCFLIHYWEKYVFSFYIAYSLCRSSFPYLRVCTRYNQKSTILPPASSAREEAVLCSSTYSLRKIASMKN